MPTLEQCLRESADFSGMHALAHPRVRQRCGASRVFEGGVRTWVKVTEGTGLHMLLGEFVVDGVSVQTFKAALNFEERKVWDDLFEAGWDITAYKATSDPALDIFHRIMRFRSPAPLLVSARDFEVLISEKFENDGSFVCKCQSVEPPKVPPRKGTVRGRILTTGFVATQRGPNAVNVFYAAQIDPCGWIPSQVVNLIISRQARSIQKLKKHVLAKKRELDKSTSTQRAPARPAANVVTIDLARLRRANARL